MFLWGFDCNWSSDRPISKVDPEYSGPIPISRQSRTITIFPILTLTNYWSAHVSCGVVPPAWSEVVLCKAGASRLDGVLDSNWRRNESIVC